MRYRIISVLLLIMLLVLMLPVSALAIADPDSPPTINEAVIYENLLETGDVALWLDYFIDYAVNPTETATEAYMGIFVDSDGTTQLRTVSPYNYHDNGYGRGLMWIYFSADDVTALGITSADEILYKVWHMGNPTLGWVPGPDPPKTIASLDNWVDSTPTIISLAILNLAEELSINWSIDLTQNTPLGTKLSTLGEDYFTNVIPNARDIAPGAFSAGTSGPITEDIDYTTQFGATMTNGTGTVIGSPITLVEGVNSVNVTVNGTFTFELLKGTVGTVTNDTGTITGSPLELVEGTNTGTTTGIGLLNVDVNLVNTQTVITDTIVGTGFDLTALATIFGMTRSLFSGGIWLLITILVCAAVYKLQNQRADFTGGGGKVVLLVFNVCMIGGAVLGFLPVLVSVLLFTGYIAYIGYVIFFRQAGV